MLNNYLLVGFGGFLGAIARFGMDGFVQRVSGQPGFPVGTLAINLSGAFLLGCLMESFTTGGFVPPHIRLMLGVGFLGAFTTFSTLSYESLRLAGDAEYGLALFNAFGSIALGLAVTWLGMFLVRLLLRLADLA